MKILYIILYLIQKVTFYLVVIVADDVLFPVILDRYGGYALDMSERLFVGTVRFTVCGEKYIIETNYKSVHDVYARLPIYS